MEFIIVLLFGVIFTTCGLLIKLKPPSKKSIYAYKTPLSLKNNDTWNDGNRIASNFMLVLGPIYLVISLLLKNYISLESSNMYPFIILSGMLLPVIPNIYLMFKFDTSGIPRK